MIYPIVLCGGTGTRLWPASRRAYPKQFMEFREGKSLFQDTLQRLATELFAEPTIVTLSEYRFIAEDQVMAAGVRDAEILLEPRPRNTAPAAIAGLLRVVQRDPDAVVLLLPSDQLIEDREAFQSTIRNSLCALDEKSVLIFGVQPTREERRLGWLQLSALPAPGETSDLVAFTENPSNSIATELLESGTALWNSGIFLARGRALVEALQGHAPDLVLHCSNALDAGAQERNCFRLGASPYDEMRGVSIETAVIEPLDSLRVRMLDAGWSDPGSWDSFGSLLPKGLDNVRQSGAVTAIRCQNSVLRSEDDTVQLVGLGLRNIAAVATKDAVLVADLEEAQSVGDAVATLRASGVIQAEESARYHRPWGWYETLCLGDRFQVKRIMVKPGAKLSLQSHVHRAEHWVVVSGTALITVGDEEKLLCENQSVYIPLGAVHRMENPGRVPMYLIEVQTGTYLAEDDIIRYEDIYSRV